MAHKFSLNHLSSWSLRSIETMVISLMSYNISVYSTIPSPAEAQTVMLPLIQPFKTTQMLPTTCQYVNCIHNIKILEFCEF